MSVEAEPELHQILDENFNKLRDDLEEFFRRNQQTIADEQSKVYSPIINKLEGELHEALEEYEQTNEATRDNSNELARKNAILANLIKKSAKLHRKVRDANIMSRSVHSWIEDSNDRLLLARRFEDLYIKNAIPRVFFSRWVRKMHQKRNQRIENEARQIYEKESRSRAAEYNAQIEKLEAELANARNELETKQKSFIDMQKKLRKAFMRGVVNLNLEAMDVFNGAQFMDMTQEVEGKTGGTHDSENEVEEGDDEFYVEESPNISVIRH